MSSVSMSGGCSAALFSSPLQTGATGSDRSQKLFGKLDVNGDGAIDQSELKAFADDISSKTGTTVDVDSMLTTLDSDGDGSVNSTELINNGRALFDQLREQLMSSQLQSRPQPPDPSEMFGEIDTDGDGSITEMELKTFLSQRGDGAAGGPDAADILARDDADGDGSISSAEFKAAVQRGPGGPPPSSSQDDVSSLVASLLEQYGSDSTGKAVYGSLLNVAA